MKRGRKRPDMEIEIDGKMRRRVLKRPQPDCPLCHGEGKLGPGIIKSPCGIVIRENVWFPCDCRLWTRREFEKAQAAQ